MTMAATALPLWPDALTGPSTSGRLKTAAETRRGTWECAACEHEAADGSVVDGSDADDDFTAPNDSRIKL